MLHKLIGDTCAASLAVLLLYIIYCFVGLFKPAIALNKTKQEIQKITKELPISETCPEATVYKAALYIIKASEGLRLKSYVCVGGAKTIGYGITNTGKDSITLTEANLIVKQRYIRSYQTIARNFPYYNTRETSAIAIFHFNVGKFGPGLLAVLNKGKNPLEQMAKYNKVRENGRLVVKKGLVKRRALEARLYKATDNDIVDIIDELSPIIFKAIEDNEV